MLQSRSLGCVADVIGEEATSAPRPAVPRAGVTASYPLSRRARSSPLSSPPGRPHTGSRAASAGLACPAWGYAPAAPAADGTLPAPSFAASPPRNSSTPRRSTSSIDTPSTPGAPRLARTSRQALRITSLRATSSNRARKRRSRSCSAQRYSTRQRARTRSTPKAWLTDLADTALIKSLCPCSRIDEVAGPSPRGRPSRPPSTTTRSDCRSTTQPASRGYRS